MKPLTCALLWQLTTAAHCLSAQTPTEAPAGPGAERPTITIVGHEDRPFDSLQAALDDAAPGATILLGEGRFDERLTIAKPVTLVGAGADKTILGPTRGAQVALREAAEVRAEAIDAASRAAEEAEPRRELTEAEIADLTKKYEELKRLFDEYLRPVVLVDGAADVQLRSLRVTMPDAPREGGGLNVCGAVTVNEGDVRLEDCAIVGCLSSGLLAEGRSRVALHDCLVAACWGAGVSIRYTPTARCEIVGCDIRNNYHYNISVGAEECVIRDCRISGTAWSGVSCGGARVVIERNAISENARAAIYSAGLSGFVRHNLIYSNGGGVSCWHDEHPTYESNVFWKNRGGALDVHGPSEPTIRSNLIVGGDHAVSYGPQGIARGELPPALVYHFSENVLWNVAVPMVRVESKEAPEPRPLPMNEAGGNRVADPQISFDDAQKLALANAEVVQELNIEPLAGMTIASPWPITDEELAMIPDDGTRDSPKWKKLPKRPAPEESGPPPGQVAGAPRLR